MLPYALFIILVCIFLWRPIFKGEALLPGDYLAQMSPWNTVIKSTNPPPQWNPLQWDAIAQFYPWRVFYARSMNSGHIPLWNPHQFCGTPFLANGQSAVLYPGNLLFLIFTPITAFTIFAALHLFMAQAFTYKFMREIGAQMLGGTVAAICFTFSAFMVLWLELPTFISVAVYIPLTFFLIQRSVQRRSVFYGMLAGGSLGLAVLAGHLQIAFYVGLAALLWWLWKFMGLWRAEGRLYAVAKITLPFAAFIAVAILISAAQVLPSEELSINSHRSRTISDAGYAAFIGNAVKPYRLVTMFVPDFFGNPSKNNYFLGSAADYMEYGLYIGILPLMLTLIALSRLKDKLCIGFFVFLALLALLCALGTPINAPFYYLIPGFGALGGPHRILLLYFFGIAVVAGFGADIFSENATKKVRIGSREVMWGEIAALLAFLVMGIIFAITNTIGTGYIEGITEKPFSGLAGPNGRIFAVLLLVSVALLLARSRDTVSHSMFPAMVIALITADLFAFGLNYNPTCERSKVYPDTALTKKLQSLTKDGSRIAPINPTWSLYKTPEAILPPNSAMAYGLYDVQGYDSLFLKSYQQELAHIEGVDPSPLENGNMLFMKTPYDGFSHARYVVSKYDEHLMEPDRAGEHTNPPLDIIDGTYIYTTESVYDGAWAGFHNNIPQARSFMWTVPFKWKGPNCISIDNTSAPVGYGDLPVEYVCFDTLKYPGWTAKSGKKPLVLASVDDKLEVNGRVIQVSFSFDPFSFHFGLYLMLIGIALICGVGTHRFLKYNHHR